MKKIESVQVFTDAGKQPADTYYTWNVTVEGHVFKFALHADMAQKKSYRNLRISELSTGFDTGTVPLHPYFRVALNEAHFSKLGSRAVKQVVRSALHQKLASVGRIRFLQAIVGAQMAVFTNSAQKLAASVETVTAAEAVNLGAKALAAQIKEDVE